MYFLLSFPFFCHLEVAFLWICFFHSLARRQQLSHTINFKNSVLATKTGNPSFMLVCLIILLLISLIYFLRAFLFDVCCGSVVNSNKCNWTFAWHHGYNYIFKFAMKDQFMVALQGMMRHIQHCRKDYIFLQWLTN